MYDIPIERIIAEIKAKDAKRVMIQLPDGLKQHALIIQERIRKATDAEIIFWSGSNYGACDLPVGLERLGIDLLIHLGHTEWVY